MLFDTHCHLTDNAFLGEIPEIIRRSVEAQVSSMINIGLDASSSQRAKEIAHDYGIWFTAGIHPSETDKIKAKDFEIIRALLEDERAVAVGEIGIDYYWPEPASSIQIDTFHEMLDIASSLAKPVVIHQRNSFKDVISTIDQHPEVKRGVFHCFGGTPDQVEQVISRGFHISFTGNVTFKKANLDQTIRAVPSNRLLLETDSPYLAPSPYRGKRNEPAYIRFTAKKISEVLQLSLEELSLITSENARKLFNINDRLF